MFGLSFAELMVIAVVGLLVIGPKELPVMLYHLGRMMRRLSYVRYAFSNQFEQFMQQVEKDQRKTGQPDKKMSDTKPDSLGEDDDDALFDYAALPRDNPRSLPADMHSHDDTDVISDTVKTDDRLPSADKEKG